VAVALPVWPKAGEGVKLGVRLSNGGSKVGLAWK